MTPDQILLNQIATELRYVSGKHDWKVNIPLSFELAAAVLRVARPAIERECYEKALKACSDRFHHIDQLTDGTVVPGSMPPSQEDINDRIYERSFRRALNDQ